jgi:lipopolysaccharide biosynthesis protein
MTEMSAKVDLHIHRRNIGLDFASWFTALEILQFEIEDCLQVVLANDSCLGPIGNLQKSFDAGAELNHDVYSITDSWQGGYHMQSYFLSFGADVNKSGFLSNFFASYDFPLEKEKVVTQGEIALSQKLAAAGFSIGAIHSYGELRDQFVAEVPRRVSDLLQSQTVLKLREVIPDYVPVEVRSLLAIYEDLSSGLLVNPSHTFWELLLSRDCQFLKHDLLTNNPTNQSL